MNIRSSREWVALLSGVQQCSPELEQYPKRERTGGGVTMGIID